MDRMAAQLENAQSLQAGTAVKIPKPSLTMCQAIQKGRTTKGLTQQNLARQLGITENDLAAIEKGTKVPTGKTRAAIQRILQITLPQPTRKIVGA